MYYQNYTLKITLIFLLLFPIRVIASPELVTIGGQQYVLEESLLYLWDGVSRGNLVNQGDLLSSLSLVTFQSGNGTTQNPYRIDYCLQIRPCKIIQQHPTSSGVILIALILFSGILALDLTLLDTTGIMDSLDPLKGTIN